MSHSKKKTQSVKGKTLKGPKTYFLNQPFVSDVIFRLKLEQFFFFFLLRALHAGLKSMRLSWK